MKVIIAGSRTITDLSIVETAIKASEFDITKVVCGMARGVDLLGRDWALKHSIPVIQFPANWKEYGRAAGQIRNLAMAEYADALIAVWDGHSVGTKGMIHSASKRGLKIHIHKV